MSYISDIRENPAIVDYGSHVRIDSDTRFPVTTAVRVDYTLTPPLTTYDFYPKYALAAYIANTSDISVNLSGGNTTIGNVKPIDSSTGSAVYANIIYTQTVGSTPVGAQLVLTQDYNSVTDSFTIGDRTGHYADVNIALSALQVAVMNTVAVTGTVGLSHTVAVSGNVGIPDTVKVSYADTGSLDAFSRLRTSAPFTLFDSKTLHGPDNISFSSAISSGSLAFNFNDSSTTISTTGFGYSIRQTSQRFNYQAGKSQLAIFTGVLSADNLTTKRYGLFSSLTATPTIPEHGLYFETSNSAISACITNSGGLVASQAIAQANWNIDTFGAGALNPSGVTVDFTKAQIFAIDYQWLGVGRVRFGLIHDGSLHYCHQFNNSNKYTGVYITEPNLPFRAEVISTGGSGIGSMKKICATIISEGGEDFSAITQSVDTGATSLTIVQDNRRAIIGLRLLADRLDAVTTVKDASVMVNPPNNDPGAYKYELVLNPTISGTGGGSWSQAGIYSDVEVWVPSSTTPAETVSQGFIVVSGFGSSYGQGINLRNFDFSRYLRLGCSAAGIRDELYLVVTPIGSTNSGVYGTLTFAGYS
jgi:hypothetical protein